LFVGTEFGLWISVDGGQRWAQYKGSDFPAVAVRDIVVHPRESDLVLATHGRGTWIIDDISPLRTLNPDQMSKEATLIAGRPAVQFIGAGGGWPEGDSTFFGPSRPEDAPITYYQKGRHNFGALKIEVLDSNGKLVDTVSGGKHRGLNRAYWSMRVKAPTVAPAATILGEAAQGPHVLPGTYTVKLTKGDHTYTEELKVVLDPRVKFSVEDRKVQFDLAMKVYRLLEHMTYGVDAIEGVRNDANTRASKLAEKDALRAQLQLLAGKCDELRGKLVATKEGGAVTGEERIRELLGQLYGAVNGYEGRPGDYQAARADSLGHELEDVINDFRKLTDQELPAINKKLQSKKAEAIKVLAESEWRARQSGGEAGGGGSYSRSRDNDSMAAQPQVCEGCWPISLR
jgi:hypothetical protein